ncbi:MAG: cyclodeaminase/cyclohydrolase family protein [Candidatus Porifericomitaceae bacterium WSBS_2022_MAG_OTU9]
MNDLDAEVGLEQKSVGEFMEELASAMPAPGGGAAGGVNGAIGAALVGMVCRITMKKDNGSSQEGMAAVLEQADRLRGEILRSAHDDYLAFCQVIDAYKLPRGSAAEIESRTAKIAAATKTATAVPLRCAKHARAVMELAHSIAATGTPSVISDAAAAALSAYSALGIAALNVKINTKHSKDFDFRDKAEQELSQYLDGALELLEQTNNIVCERM